MTRLSKLALLLSILLLLNIVVSCQVNRAKEEKDWETVHSAVENVRPTFNLINENIKFIYNDLSMEKKEENLQKLTQIKNLASQLDLKTDQSLQILKNNVTQGDTVEIFKVGIEYLTAIENIEPLFPEMYEKIENDIYGNPTEKNFQLVEAAENIMSIGYEYKRTMDDY